MKMRSRRYTEEFVKLTSGFFGRGVLASGAFFDSMRTPCKFVEREAGQVIGQYVIGFSRKADGLHWRAVVERDGQRFNRRGRIELEVQPCRFGGSRAFFRCPVCGRRCSSIYFMEQGFACRQCAGLSYACQSERTWTRCKRRIRKLRSRLGWSAFSFMPDYCEVRPKGMHRKTYARLLAKHEEASNALGRMMRRPAWVDGEEVFSA